MKTKLKKYTLKHYFPFIETCFIGSFLFLLCVCVYKYVSTEEIEQLLLIIGVALGLVFFYWMANHRNKSVTFNNEITIKPWLSFSPTVLKTEDIEGYLRKESYTHSGLAYHIQILTKSGRKIEFKEELYPEYGKLKIYLDNYGIKYLGKKQIKWKYKHVYSRIGVYTSVAAAVLFVLVQLMKLLK